MIVREFPREPCVRKNQFSRCLIVTTLGLMMGCSGTKEPEPVLVRPVKTWLVTAGDGIRERTFPGIVEASRRVELAFRVPGLLAELPVKEGQKVAKGELIAQLRQDEFQARLQTLQGELDQARATLQALQAGERPEEIRRREAELRSADAQLVNARSEYDRHALLLSRNAVSKSAYEQRETAYRVAQEAHTAAFNSLEQATVGREEDVDAMRAQVRALEGRLVEAQINLNDSTLLAPFDGVIAQRFVDQGQNILANDRVVQFKDLNEIDIAVDVPESVMAAEVRYADMEQLTASLISTPGVDFPVRIREVAQVADPVTQTFNVRVAMFAPPDIRMLPGMSATVTMRYRRASILGAQTLIPIEAVSQTPAGTQVAWVLGEDLTVSPRTIKLGGASGGKVEVVEGLNPGDRIVNAGVRFLRQGMKVRDLGDAIGGGRS